MAWLLLPAAALVAANGAARPDLPHAWRSALALACGFGLAAVALLAARHAQNLNMPWWVVVLAPPMCIVWAYGVSDSKPLAAMLFIAGFAVSFMLWVLLGLRALGGTTAVLLLNDALLVVAAPLLIVSLCKHFATPRPAPPPVPEAASVPEAAAVREAAAAPEREAALQQRLASDEAQEAADKYTRD